MLKERHPLGIQVNLHTGVANGVLVARTEAECAELIRRIVTATLEFDVTEEVRHGTTCSIVLRERITGERLQGHDRCITSAQTHFGTSIRQTPS